MALGEKAADLAAANQLNISITTITQAQSWKRQVRGAYSFLYLHAQKDFLHVDDFADWVKQFYNNHFHGNGNQGSPTTKPLQPSQITDTRAKALLIASKVLGKIRRGVSSAVTTSQDIDRANNREIT